MVEASSPQNRFPHCDDIPALFREVCNQECQFDAIPESQKTIFSNLLDLVEKNWEAKIEALIVSDFQELVKDFDRDGYPKHAKIIDDFLSALQTHIDQHNAEQQRLSQAKTPRPSNTRNVEIEAPPTPEKTKDNASPEERLATEILQGFARARIEANKQSIKREQFTTMDRNALAREAEEKAREAERNAKMLARQKEAQALKNELEAEQERLNEIEQIRILQNALRRKIQKIAKKDQKKIQNAQNQISKRVSKRLAKNQKEKAAAEFEALNAPYAEQGFGLPAFGISPYEHYQFKVRKDNYRNKWRALRHLLQQEHIKQRYSTIEESDPSLSERVFKAGRFLLNKVKYAASHTDETQQKAAARLQYHLKTEQIWQYHLDEKRLAGLGMRAPHRDITHQDWLAHQIKNRVNAKPSFWSRVKAFFQKIWRSIKAGCKKIASLFKGKKQKNDVDTPTPTLSETTRVAHTRGMKSVIMPPNFHMQEPSDAPKTSPRI